MQQRLSVTKIAQRLGVDPLTVKRHAARLGLGMGSKSRQLKQLPPEVHLKQNRNAIPVDEAKLHGYRDEWFTASERRLKRSLKVMRAKLPRVYSFLRRYDPVWLRSHTAPAVKRKRRSNSVDWRKRDIELAKAVRKAANRLRNCRGRPKLISKSAIAREMGKATLLRQKISKLPLTAKALNSVVETRVGYALRRVQWSASFFRSEGILPSRWQLILRANVYNLRNDAEIEAAIENAIKHSRGIGTTQGCAQEAYAA